MRKPDLEAMSVDDLWNLHEALAAELSNKMAAERTKLEEWLQKLGSVKVERARRPYPKVLPKYRNPKNRNETWAGRGKQPRWVTAQLQSGKKLDDLLIRQVRARAVPTLTKV